MELASNNSQITGNLGSGLDTDISQHRRHAASHLRTLLYYHISVNRDHISGHFATHEDGAIYAYDIARFLPGLDENVTINLDAVRALFC